MRIISGKYRGHQLVDFKASHIRPTTGRVKESLFNILIPYWEGARVLDLFAGTGNLGLEALSRGAREVIFVEKNPRSIEILKKNIAKLRVSEPFQIVSRDVLTYLKAYKGEPFDVIMADPPFTEEMAHEVMIAAAKSAAFGAHTVMSIESGPKEKIEDDYSPISRYDARDFGDKTLSFYSRVEVAGDPSGKETE